MSFPPNDDLKRAIEALSVWDVWERAASDGVVEAPPPNRRDGLVKSPFRDDGRKGSFSICHQGKGYKDFGGAGDDGNSWYFGLLCWPQLPKKELAGRFIEWSGITPTPKQRPEDRGQKTEEGGAGGSPVPPDPRLLKAAKAMDRRDRARQEESKMWEEFEKSKLPQCEAVAVPAWPACVRERFEEGREHLAKSPAAMNKLAADRGWPVAWVEVLAESGLLSWPVERWSEVNGIKARRQKAFPVQVPVVKTVAHARVEDGAFAEASLHVVGYHQRMFILGRNGAPDSKGWLYVPSLPSKTPQSKFEGELVKHAASVGVTLDNKRGLIPPVPFVLGDLRATRTVVILEGQWDAITFFGACGWFDEGVFPGGVAVLGVRGAQGVEPFLAYWQKWLRYNKPLAWIIADNDEAGSGWLNAPAAKPGLPAPLSFGERLKWLGCRDVKTSVLKRGAWGKDFNDYYRAAKPSPVAMGEWMKRVGVV